MYRTASILFFSCFFVYVFFSRQPDFFSSEKINGVVVDAANLTQAELAKFKLEPADHPVAKYNVGADIYYYNGKGNWFFRHIKTGEKVTIICDSTYPEQASIYRLAGYWIVLGEVLFLLAGYGVLFGVAMAITGKQELQNPNDADDEKKTKYN